MDLISKIERKNQLQYSNSLNVVTQAITRLRQLGHIQEMNKSVEGRWKISRPNNR